VSFTSTNNIRQGGTPQSERLDRERLGKLGLEFRVPNDVMEYVLPFLGIAYFIPQLGIIVKSLVDALWTKGSIGGIIMRLFQITFLLLLDNLVRDYCS